ncbi:ADP-ribosylation factor-like protein 6-interacting protein 6 [Brachionichthys hirsutus]|uniref:ADP-ribosylation factor-like protein 6-interacting protein 6 n=1 Tax=Brachionichthys hirsutus TaxID=412623 RepID=UPI0036045ECD
MRTRSSAADRDIAGRSSARPCSSEETEDRDAVKGRRRRIAGPGRWGLSALSVVGSAVVVAAVGCLCALLYPILQELRTDRVRGQDGTEQRILGFWSVSVLSVTAGCVCSVVSWTLNHLDGHRAGSVLPLANVRDEAAFDLGSGLALLNGLAAALTVVWSLS